MPTVHSSSRRKDIHATGQPWPVERKVELVLEGLRGRRPVAELCRESGISPARYYRWRNQFINAARTGLAHPEAECCMLKERVQQLKVENASLQTRLRIFQELSVAD
jgi:transposase-like protein